MDTITRYSRRIRMTLIKAVTLICFICLVYIPKGSTSEVISQDTGYFTVTLNNKVLGAVNTQEEAEQALIEARGRISAELGRLVYMDPELIVTQEEYSFGQRMSVDDMSDVMYNELIDTEIVFDKQDAYAIRINDYTITLGSKEEIVEVMNGVKESYDVNNEFQVRLTGSTDVEESQFGIEIVKADIGGSAAAKVVSVVDGSIVVEADEDTVYEDGSLAMIFSETLSVTPIEVNADRIVSVDAALEDITKETEEKTIYTVQSGDTLSQIAQAYNLSTSELVELNDGLSQDGVIGIGDEIVVTVPTPELSIVYFEESTYEESYDASVQYIDDDTMYQNEVTVIQEGSEGYHEVVAVIRYENGQETDRTIIRETIIVESVPRILRRGTKALPTYIKPIAGGTLTSTFGARWGTTHKGVDWGVPVGTSVMASSSGVVVRSGWYSGYGICVDIRHPDGTLTRYGHLSKTLVSVGETVSQGQQIAKSGNTGQSTGPHVHFEIHVNGVQVNPLNYLN
jgi:murein DD-endopeptidase MepM/ murein hydrolase activator NlpD